MVQAICWTLLHSLWQGLFFALIAGGVMLLTRRAGAAVRYNVLCGLFFTFLAVCAGTFIYEVWQSGPSIEEGAFAAGTGKGGRVAAWIDVLGRYCSEHAVLIVWGWLFVFTIKSLRMLGSYLYTQRVRHYGISAAPAEWREKVARLAGEMGIRRAVRLVESQIVKMPLVIGHLRPIILMPLGLITGLPEGEIEAVLLHELAHIRRHDYIVNFLQNVAVNVFFFNPGFLWMSSLMREERENCCDDIAIARTHDRAGFIRALISFKEHDLRLAAMTNAFPGRKNQLIKRAMRIAQRTNKTLDPVEKIFLIVSFVLISVLVAATSRSSAVTPARMAQIPGGKYRYFVDTPSREVQTPVLKKVEGRRIVIQRMPGRRQESVTFTETKFVENSVMAQKAMVDAQVAQDNEQVQREKKQALDNAMQSARDQEQALRDKRQAEMDAQQAIRDREQADRDRAQADRDSHQAELDKQQAERDKVQTDRDRAQADRDKEQAVRDKKQAEMDAQQAMRDRAQAYQAREKVIRDKAQKYISL